MSIDNERRQRHTSHAYLRSLKVSCRWWVDAASNQTEKTGQQVTTMPGPADETDLSKALRALYLR